MMVLPVMEASRSMETPPPTTTTTPPHDGLADNAMAVEDEDEARALPSVRLSSRYVPFCPFLGCQLAGCEGNGLSYSIECVPCIAAPNLAVRVVVIGSNGRRSLPQG